jgi:hypothetical protein
MKRQLPHKSSPCTRKGDEHCYCSSDGRFRIRNTWCVDNIREPNWLLIDHATGRTYRFFVRQQAEQKMEELLAQTT